MKLFLSYASETARLAEEVQLAVTGEGHQVFFDRPSLIAGEDYNLGIREAVEASDGMIFLISPQSVEPGSYTLTELKYARLKWAHPKRRVLPVMVESTRLDAIPTYLKAVTILKPEGNVAAEITEAIRCWHSTTPSARRTEESLSQIRGLFIISVATILVAIAIGTLFSLIYPKVEISLQITCLFLLFAVPIVLATRGLLNRVRHP